MNEQTENSEKKGEDSLFGKLIKLQALMKEDSSMYYLCKSR